MEYFQHGTMFETWKIMFCTKPHTIFHKDFITYQRTIMIIQTYAERGKIPGNPLGGPPCISIFGITPPRQLTNYTLTQQNHCESQKLSWRFAHTCTYLPKCLVTISTIHVALDNYIDWTICHLLSRRLKVFFCQKVFRYFSEQEYHQRSWRRHLLLLLGTKVRS